MNWSDRVGVGRTVVMVAVRLVLAVVFVTLVAHSRGPELADRSRPGVRAEEQRIEALVVDHGLWNGPHDWSCRVRLLRQSGATSWAWAVCGGRTSSGGFAAPVRVDGESVWYPTDDAFLAGVRSHFPADLVDIATSGNNELTADLGLPVGGPLPTPLPSR